MIAEALREIGHSRVQPDELIKYTGLSKSTVYNAISRLKLKHIVHVEYEHNPGGGKLAYYSLAVHGDKDRGNSLDKG